MVNPVDFLKENQSYLKKGDKAVAERLGITNGRASEAKSAAKKELKDEGSYRYSSSSEEETFDEGPEESTDNDSTSENTSVDDSIPEDAQDAWEEHMESLGITEDDIESVKYWQTMSGDHRFSVVQKFNEESKTRQGLIDVLEDHFEDYEPPEVEGSADVVGDGNLGVINLYDAHIDKLALATETNEDEDRSMQDNIDRFEDAFMEFLDLLEENNVTRAHFPLGHDLLNTNGAFQMTKNGTPQRVSVPWQTSYLAGLEMIRRCVDSARQVLDDLEIIMVPGNHSPDKTFYLGATLEHIYRSCEDVAVDNGREKRKYRKEGRVLLGYSHGEETKSQSKIEKLPLNMAVEADEKWADADFRIMFLGDIHHKKKYKILSTVDSVGCEVNFLRSIGPQNRYEFKNGYTGVPKTAQLDVFSGDGRRRWHQEKSWW
jgi:hypothetical protein